MRGWGWGRGVGAEGDEVVMRVVVRGIREEGDGIDRLE